MPNHNRRPSPINIPMHQFPSVPDSYGQRELQIVIASLRNRHENNKAIEEFCALLPSWSPEAVDMIQQIVIYFNKRSESATTVFFNTLKALIETYRVFPGNIDITKFTFFL